MTTVDPLVNQTLGQLDPMVLNMLGAGPIEKWAGISRGDQNRFNRTLQRTQNRDVFLAGSKGAAVDRKRQLDLFKDQAKTPAGQSRQVGPPSEDYGQKVAQAGAHTYQPLSAAGQIHFIDEKTGKPIRGKLSPEGFHTWMKNKEPGEAKAFADRNGLIQDKAGNWMVPVQQDAAGLQQLLPVSNLLTGGALSQTMSVGQMKAQQISGQQSAAGSAFSSLSRNSWMLPAIGGGMGFLGGGVVGGIGGLAMGFLGAKALKSAAAGQTTGSLGLMAPGFSGIGGGGGGIGGFGLAALGGLAGGAGGMSTMFSAIEGSTYHLKNQMRATADVMQDQMLIGMINNPGIPIEDLIFLFMAHMGDKYERKLRAKMEEAARAEQRETMRERERDQIRRDAAMAQATAASVGSGLGALGGLFGPVGMMLGMAGSQVGMAIGQFKAAEIQTRGEARIMLNDAMQGHTKSATILMNEVQVLMQKWQRLNELMSNLLKSMHDMAMTPIRNLR